MQVSANFRPSFVKAAMLLAQHERPIEALAEAEARGMTMPAGVLKAAISPIDGDALIGTRASRDFTAAVHAAEIIGRLRERRTAGFEVRTPAVTSTATSYWIPPDGGQIPLTRISLQNITLENRQLATICAMSEEVLRA